MHLSLLGTTRLLSRSDGKIYTDAFIKKALERADLDNPFYDVLEKHNQMRSDNLDQDYVYCIESTKQRFGITPDLKLVEKLIDTESIDSFFSLEKWLLNWEMEKFPNEELFEPIYTGYLDWYMPSKMNQLQVLALLPIKNSWEVLHFWEFYGGAEIPMAMLKYWHKKYGAELVAHFGTMLQFVVKNPPQNMEDAFQLACEQESIAFCTTIQPGISLRDHARVLLKADKWFLHERP